MAQIKKGRWVTASGQSISSAVALGSETLVGFYTPAALNAEQVKLQASVDGATFVDILDAGTPLTAAVAAAAYVPVDATRLLGAAHVRVVHQNSSAQAVNESAERVILPVFRAFE